MLQLLEPFQYLWNALTAERSPRQIAWGMAIGMWLGMIPKGNLTAWLVGVILLATRVNLGCGMLTAMGVTAISTWVDPLTHGIGQRLLNLEGLRSLLATWHDAPLVPWLCLNNTVVLGSTTLGLVLLYPVQHVMFQIVSWVSPLVQRWWNRKADREAEETPQFPASVEDALRQVAASADGTDTGLA